MTTCPEIYTVRVHPVSEMVRVMPTETEVTEAKTASPIIAPQQETIVLTACMRSKDVREDVLPMLIEDDFVKSDHRTLFRAIRAMHEADYPIDEVSLLDYLKSSRMLDAAGGEKAVLRMFESDMPLLSWQAAYDGLIDASRRRSLVMAMNEIEAKAYGTPPDMKAFVSKIENSVAQVTEHRDMRPYRHISSLLGAAVDEVRRLDEVPLESTVVNTGFATLDEMLAGLRAGQLIVVGARPAVGKTSFALTLALNAARQGVKVGIFSLEMSGRELAQRIICAESGVSISHFRMGTIPKTSWDAIAAACCDIPGNDIEIEDRASVTIGDIRTTAARMMRGAERGLIVIDYLQLISSASDGAGFQNRAVEVGEISRRLKVLAKELGVPVVTLAQLSRQAEFHPGAPRLSDLRESGSIEQDADTVLFLSRDPNETGDEKSGARQVILSIAKNRSGPTGDIDMLFVPTSTKFYEVGPRKENCDD